MKVNHDLVNGLISYVLKSVDPYERTLEHLKEIRRPNGKIFLVAFGKSSVKMAKAALDVFEIEKGVVVTNEEVKKSENPDVEYIKGGHPIPNESSVIGAKDAIEILQCAHDEDLILVMISGGGSALFEYPKVDLDILKNVTDSLMKKGANINELNAVRKSLSFMKGGKLPSYTRAKMISFVMSDVVGDDLAIIASGPTFSQHVDLKMSLEILEKYKVALPKMAEDTTLNEEEREQKDVEHVLIATNKDACLAAKEFLEKKGLKSVYLGSAIQGEAREVAKTLGGIYVESLRNRSDFLPPIAFVSGGETTVSVKGNGKGGRNQEMALAMAPIVAGKDITFLSFGTDGIDGHSSAAGAVVDGTTLERARRSRLDYRVFLDGNDSFNFFDKLSDTIVTGPTGTNVTDIQIAIVGSKEG